MSIEVQSNEPKVETKAAPAAEASQQAQSGSEKTAAGANASAEIMSADSETVENEESTESETEPKASESETDKDAQDPASKEPTKKKGGFQRRIDKLNARVSAKEQELEYWKQQALKGGSSSKTESPKVEPTKPATGDGKPNPDSFDTHAAYVEALTDWKTDQKFKELSQKQAQSQLQTEQAKRVQSYVEKRKEFQASTPDFDEVMEDVDDITLSSAVQEVLLSSENGPKLAYELAKNREELARICKLTPLAAARELGRLEARFSSASSPEKKSEQKTTKAPAPLAPVRGGGTASIPKSLEEAANSSFAEYKKLRAAEIKKRRQA